MQSKIQSELRDETIHNVLRSELSTADKECIVAIFERYEQLERERDVVCSSIKKLIDADDICQYCENKVSCQGEKCPKYSTGKGAHDSKGRYYDWEWSCMDFDFGTCEMMEGTPCASCFENGYSGFRLKMNNEE